ncbi:MULTISPECIES: hypothetical protein [Enterococcus]|uniref:Phage protein n=1 Tax=Enterococcus durans TaxID=53345 RepID=A0AB36S9T4_9ENTE|nr:MULTISPECIES: hypothetical protein [Enterococcus]EOU22574.1 hypothetical protein I571_01144 [Enterococcus durans ATCC 6056]MBD9757904.1 hypothetical protein [Enterococcus faecium]MDQ8513150.1 hypothetical protein [Enterococcus faecium]NTK45979.1 hypothetical protein [Enterococcus faecium]NVD81237.1 hypothetical protein [Enterococcus faecium]
MIVNIISALVIFILTISVIVLFDKNESLKENLDELEKRNEYLEEELTAFWLSRREKARGTEC